MSHDPKDDILQIRLSKWHSIDFVRVPKTREYRVVFAERFGVQRRAFVDISFEQAVAIARFLVSVDDEMHQFDPNDPPTDPGSPKAMPPVEVSEMTMSRTVTKTPPDPSREILDEDLDLDQ